MPTPKLATVKLRSCDGSFLFQGQFKKMSSIRNAVHRRDHKERAQPAHRTKLGLLEKHKDYVLRARDFHHKEDRLRALRERARNRNPDEFYHAMINSKTKQGVHVVERLAKFTPEEQLLLKSRDIKYVKLARDVERGKIDRLKQQLHFFEHEDGEDDEVMHRNDHSTHATKKPRHIVFVDSSEQGPLLHLLLQIIVFLSGIV